MKLLEGIQAFGSQTFKTNIDNGESVTITLNFKPSIKMWFIDLEYKDFKANGIRVCNSTNLLRQFEKILPFGLNVSVSDNGEPFIINDFTTKRVRLGILTINEVLQINQAYEDAKI